VGVLFNKEPNVLLLVVWAKQQKVLTSNDAVTRAVKKEMLLIFNRLHRTLDYELGQHQWVKRATSHPSEQSRQRSTAA